MNLDELFACFGSPACLVTQVTSGAIIGMLLFLVAVGLTLIFGVLKVVNFAHGALYMIGAYLAFTVYKLTGSYTLAILGGASGTAVVAIVFERLLMSRVYGQNVLMQLLVCYGFILIMDDLVKIIWGPEFRSMGMPPTFAVPPYFIAGGIVPPFYVFLVGMAILMGVLLWLVIEKTRIGKTVTAAAQNQTMVAALGVNTQVLYALVFGLGGLLAGAAGALAAPVRSLTPGMGLSIVIESFIVTVIGGMGSIAGAFVAAIVIGLSRSFGALAMPLFTDGLMFLVMVIVLIVRPTGLFGKEVR
jgi:branched-chain amino acid transport system permease protein